MPTKRFAPTLRDRVARAARIGKGLAPCVPTAQFPRPGHYSRKTSLRSCILSAPTPYHAALRWTSTTVLVGTANPRSHRTSPSTGRPRCLQRVPLIRTNARARASCTHPGTRAGRFGRPSEGRWSVSSRNRVSSQGGGPCYAAMPRYGG